MIEDPWFYLAAVAALLLTGVSKGGFGGGVGIVGVPLMALTVSPAQAAAIMLPILCLMDLVNLYAYRRRWDWRNLKIMIPGALVGIAIGALMFNHLTADHLRLVIGLIAVAFTVHRWAAGAVDARRAKPGSPAKATFWALVAGFTSFAAHSGGPPINVYLLPQRLDKTTYQATTVVFFTVLNYVKLAPYAWLGLLASENLQTSLVLSPLAFVGIGLGVALHRRVPHESFYRIAYVLLFLTGLKLLYDGITGTLV